MHHSHSSSSSCCVVGVWACVTEPDHCGEMTLDLDSVMGSLRKKNPKYSKHTHLEGLILKKCKLIKHLLDKGKNMDNTLKMEYSKFYLKCV